MVFFPMTLSPSNPQHYNPEAYLFSSFVAIAAMILLSVLLQTIFPTTDTLRRRWDLKSARAEMHALLAGSSTRLPDDERRYSAMRIALGSWPRSTTCARGRKP